MPNGLIEDGAWDAVPSSRKTRSGRAVVYGFWAAAVRNQYTRGAARTVKQTGDVESLSSVQNSWQAAVPPVGQHPHEGATRGLSRVAAVRSLPFLRAERSVLSLRVPMGRRSRA